MHPCTQYSTNKRGFTLSELLISLAVLGLISALTLPTIFNKVEESQRKALLKESIQLLQTQFYDVLSTGKEPNGPSFCWNIQKYLSVKKRCTTECIYGGWGGTVDVELQNNVQISCLITGPLIIIDTNGTQGPNSTNTDRIFLTYRPIPGTPPVGPYPWPVMQADVDKARSDFQLVPLSGSTNLYNSLFTN